MFVITYDVYLTFFTIVHKAHSPKQNNEENAKYWINYLEEKNAQLYFPQILFLCFSIKGLH